MDAVTTINPFIIEDISLPRLTAQFGSTTYRTEIAKMFAAIQLTWDRYALSYTRRGQGWGWLTMP